MLKFRKRIEDERKSRDVSLGGLNKEENVPSNNTISLLKHNQKCIVERINEKIQETGFISENLIALTNHISDNVDVQMESIKRVIGEISNYSALAEEVFASTENSKQIADETMSIAKKGTEAVDNSIQAMLDIQDSVENAKGVVNDLSTKSQHINEMLNIIKDIANSTNLLSLNASIEAARAGEAGRGFAVVAQEVKKLAQRSAESAEQISDTVNEIGISINETIGAMEKSMLKVVEGNEIANNTKKVFDNIINAVGTTNRVTEEINHAVSSQTQSLENIIALTEEMNKTSEKVIAMVETTSLNSQYTRTTLNILADVSKDLQSISTRLLKEIEDGERVETSIETFLGEAPIGYDPHMVFDNQSAQILNNVHSGLLVISSNGEITPGVANSWHVEEDNLTWVFNLRRGSKFHNGREITSEDVKSSFERLLSPSLNSPNRWFLEEIDGAVDFFSGKAREVRGIKILDKYRISIKLIRPYSGFLLNLGLYVCSIFCREDMKKGQLTGCGAYRIEKVDGDKCVLTAFKDYFGGIPYTERVIVNFNGQNAIESFINNKCHFITFDNKKQVDELKKAKIENIQYKSVMGTYYVGFNLKSNSELIMDKEIRKALNSAINRKRIIDEVLGGLGEEAKGPMPSNMVENNYLKGFDYNPRMAKEIINKKAGNLNTRLRLLVRDESEDTNFSKITKMVIEDLKQVGIECILERVKPDVYHKPDSLNKCDLFISRWICDTGDMDNFLQPMFNPSNVTDFTGYSNETVTRMMANAKEIVNPKKRMEMYKDIQKQIVEDAPWIFLYHPMMAFAARKGVIGGRISPLGIIKYNDIIMEEIN